MITVPVSDFIPSLRKIVNVPLDFLMEESLVKAAQAFCRKSEEVIYNRALGDVVALQEYTLISDSELNAAKSLLKCSAVLSVRAVDTSTSETRLLVNGEDYAVVTRDEVMFYDAFTYVVVRCAVEPVQGASELPLSLFDDYLDGICSGAASLLLIQPDSDWANPKLANYHDIAFTEAMRDAKRFRLDATPQESFDRPVRPRSFY